MKNKKEKDFLKTENRYFKLLKKSIEYGLAIPEKIEIIELMAQKIVYLQEEFLSKKEKTEKIDMINPITDGLLLIQDLKAGFAMTYCHPIQENIEQFAAHFQAVYDYEEALITFEKDRNNNTLEETKQEAEDLKDGYTEQEKTIIPKQEAYTYILQKQKKF